MKGLLISSFYHGWRRSQVTQLTERSSNSPKVTQVARGRPDVGTEALQSDFRSILTITLPCLFRLVFYLAQIHKQTENNVLLCILWKKIWDRWILSYSLLVKKKKKWDQEAIWCCDWKCRLCLQTIWVWIPAMLITSCVGKLLYLCMSSLFPLL